MSCFGRRREAHTSFSFRRLTETDELAASSHINDLVVQFGRSLLNASPADIPRLNAAVENDNSEEILAILGRVDASSEPRNNETEFISIDMFQDSLFRMAVEDCRTEWVEFFLDAIAKKSIPFSTGASMMKESFNDLWLDYRFFLEDMMTKDVLGWDVCTIEVPIETFTVESNLATRVGTCNTILDWIHASQQGSAFEHWRSLNEKAVDKLLKKSRRRKVNAIVRIFCFEDACQIGLDGIVRFLLMHKAPSYLFKSPLIKWVITFKWERMWKVMAFKRLASFLLFFVGLHIFVLSFTYEDFSFLPSESEAPLIIFSLTTTVLLPILTLRREYFQLKRYILDGRKIFPSNCFRGIGMYFSSRQNQIDLMLSVAIVAVFVLMTLFGFWARRTIIRDAVFVGITLQVLLTWAKAFYLSQAFKRSGVLVVMIGRVLRESAPYFLLLLGITVGFGLAMRVAFLEFWQEYLALPVDDKKASDAEEALDKEDEERADTSFGSLYRSMLTMAYAMVGLFDPEVLFHCGTLHGIMIALFVLYLFLQSIVMFNMLIASMGDAFDGVRAAEEELFLMARATFIDQFEASLSNKAIRKMKTKIGKYLYVLMPEDEMLEENISFWKGRIPTIKGDVRTIVMDSQNEMSQNMSQMNQKTSEMFRALMDEIKSLKQQVTTLEQRITEQDSAAGSLCHPGRFPSE